MKKNLKSTLCILLTLCIMMVTSVGAFADSTQNGTTSVSGSALATMVEITIPTAAEFTIRPNEGTAAERFVSPSFSMTNSSPAPLKVEVTKIEQTGANPYFKDVAPNEHSNWDILTKSESKDIALGLTTTASAGWTGVNTTPLYVSGATKTTMGTLAVDSTATFQLIAKHGRSFDTPQTATYTITWLLSLA